MRAHVRKLAQLATWPSEKISQVVGKVIPHNRKQGKIVAGVCLMFGGAQMSLWYPAGCFIPHCIYDACAWFLHACGCAPVMEAYAQSKQQRKEKKKHARNTQSTGPAGR